MDKNTVVWWVFEPPTEEEERALKAMQYTNIVWASEELANSMFSVVKYVDRGEIPNIARRVKEFAMANNARAVIGEWNDPMATWLKRTPPTSEIVYFTQRSPGYRGKSTRQFTRLGRL